MKKIISQLFNFIKWTLNNNNQKNYNNILFYISKT